MTLFEYLSVAVSIVLSLALIRLIGGLRAVIECESRHWISIAWISLLIGFCLLHWWSSWSFRGADWTFLKFVLMLATPAVLYSLATIVVPDDAQTVDDWSSYFASKRVPLYVTLVILFLVGILDGPLIAGAPLLALPRVGAAAGLILAVLGLAARKPGLDAPIVVVYVLLFLVFALTLLAAPDSISIALT